MGIAAHVSAWADRWPQIRSGRSNGGLVGGVPFCVDTFGPDARIIVQAAFGADLAAEPQMWNWYDITADVRYADGSMVSISPMGRSDETSTAQPAGCDFVLDNTTGDYTAFSPASTWYPYVRRSTPIRVMVNLTGQASDWKLRFQGYATGWTPSWDISANVPIVSVAAQGITRRLSQGKTPLKSALVRAVLADGPVAYWPLSDGKDSTWAASALSGGTPMLVDDFGAELTVLFGEVEGPVGSEKYPEFIVDGAYTAVLAGTVPATVSETWQAEAWWKGYTVETAGQQGFPVDFEIAGSSVVTRCTFWLEGEGRLNVTLRTSTGLAYTILATDLGIPVLDNEWHYGRVVVKQVTPTTYDAFLYLDGVHRRTQSAQVGTIGFPSSARATGYADPFSYTVPDNLSVAHIAVGTVDSDHYSAGIGYVGETPPARVARLCAEQGVPVEIAGTSATTMGPQESATFLNLLRECETAESGLLYDGLGPGVGFICRDQRYNRAADLTLDMAEAQVAHPFTPVDDDQRNVNVAQASRGGTNAAGSSAEFAEAGGPLGTDAIDVYDTTTTVSVDSDEVLIDYAGWLVHLGTVEGFRYPSLNLNLISSPEIAAAWLRCAVSSRVDVTNVTSVATQHPDGDIRLLLEGWSEQLSPLDWDVQTATSQYDPWEVGELDESQWLDCGASVLAEDLDATETGIDVAISDTCVWTHADGDYDITIGAEQMTVTAVSAASGAGSSWTQTLTVTRSVNGIAATHVAGAEVHVTDAFILAL